MDTANIARTLAEQSIVLLKNEEKLLPLDATARKVTIFGRAQVKTVFSGNGSGASRGQGTAILDACEAAGLQPESGICGFYRLQAAAEKDTSVIDYEGLASQGILNSGIMYEMFGQYHAPMEEYNIPDALMEQSAVYSDVAIMVLGRNSGGEECDRHLEGDFLLTDSERKLVSQVCGKFSHVILILNINGLIDLDWLAEYPCIKSILFIGIPGEEGAVAVADILCGNTNPSGKLSVTIARRYADYPSARYFSWDKENPDTICTYETYGLDAVANGSIGFDKSPVTFYQEDIYAGYRYFDTFGVEPLFPFGFGLSYTDFSFEFLEAFKENGEVKVRIKVKNVGEYPGREVIQLYQAPENTESRQPLQKLLGFEKTKLLMPGEEEELLICSSWEELAAYEESRAAYVIEQGSYVLKLGTSSRDTEEICSVVAEQEIVVQQCSACLPIQACNEGKLEFLEAPGMQAKGNISRMLYLIPEDIVHAGRQMVGHKGRIEGTDRTELSGFSLKELAALCVGYGPGIPFSAFSDSKAPETILDDKGKPVTVNSHPTGYNGYISPAIPEREIYSVSYKDGPAGVGKTAWPTQMLIACAFDRKLWRSFGDAAGQECEEVNAQVWLAPAVNLHRSPLGGRSFEYFSEDPLLTGICACEITKGVQENHPVIVCPKHFAVNEQETFRRGSTKRNYDAADSILTERAARELYLKPFERLVRQAGISCIMTSFNKINGIFAGGNRDLCTKILRQEWGFEGAVVTDWGDMDIVVDGADAVAAGNDIVMPGGPPVIAQILEGVRQGRITRDSLKTAVGNLLSMLGTVKK